MVASEVADRTGEADGGGIEVGFEAGDPVADALSEASGGGVDRDEEGADGVGGGVGEAVEAVDDGEHDLVGGEDGGHGAVRVGETGRPPAPPQARGGGRRRGASGESPSAGRVDTGGGTI